MNREKKNLRLLIREIISAPAIVPATVENNPALTNVISLQGLLSNAKVYEKVKNAILFVAIRKNTIKNNLKIDDATLALLLFAAIGVTGRESTFEQGTYYSLGSNKIDKAYETLRDTWDNIKGSKQSYPGASIGPAQIVYRTNLAPGTNLEDFAKLMEIFSDNDITDYNKAVAATIGILSNNYKKAISVGYSTNSPAVNPEVSMRSTGNAALDLAILGYNMGPSKITNYCGSEKIKKVCPPGSPDIVKDYFPHYSDSSSGRSWMSAGTGTLTSTGYVSEVATYMAQLQNAREQFLNWLLRTK